MKKGGKTLKASAIVELSMIFPMILFVIITLVIVVVFCFLQSKMKLAGEYELFSSEARGEYEIVLDRGSFDASTGRIESGTKQISQESTLFSLKRTFSSGEMLRITPKKGLMMTKYAVYNENYYQSNYQDRYRLKLLSRAIYNQEESE